MPNKISKIHLYTCSDSIKHQARSHMEYRSALIIYKLHLQYQIAKKANDFHLRGKISAIQFIYLLIFLIFFYNFDKIAKLKYKLQKMIFFSKYNTPSLAL